MSEPVVENAETTTEATQGDPAATESKSDNPLGPNGEKALAAEREARKAAEKASADLKARLDEIEKANLSELEKAQLAAKEAQDQLAEITRQNLRNSVALAKGVPADLVEFLTGDTEDELNAKADTLLARLNAPTTPLPDPSQGARGGDGQKSVADQFAAALEGRI